VFRPKFPTHPNGGAIPATVNCVPAFVKHVVGVSNVTPGTNGDTAVGPVDPTEGRPFDAPKSNR